MLNWIHPDRAESTYIILCYMLGADNFSQQADMMSELFVHPMIVLPTSLNKSVTPSWSEASKFQLPKVSLLILQVNRANTSRYHKNTHSTLITPHTIMLSQMHSYICICAVAYSFTLHSFYWHVLYVGSESSLNAIEVTIELNNSQCHHWP